MHGKPKVRIDDRIYTVDELRTMSRAQLDAILMELQERENRISLSMKQSRGDYAATGKSGDWQWYKRAQVALMLTQEARQQVARVRKEMKVQKQQSLAEHFLAVARVQLDTDTFGRLLEAAKRAQSE